MHILKPVRCINILRVFTLILIVLVELADGVLFTDSWAVHVKGGKGVADEVARRHGFINRGQIFTDYYSFQHHKVAKRSTFASTYYHQPLQEDLQVLWAEQQVAKSRRKRGFHFNDPKWPVTWYLNDHGNGMGMNVREAWDMGYTGKGVVVTILDDGIEKDHPDLIQNYDQRASYDVNDHDPDPQPRYEHTNDNKHGTRCAGEVAAQADNHVCSVGVAYNAKIGGVRMLDGDVTDSIEAQSLGHEPQYVHVYSASWGPDDDGRTVDGPATLTRKAFYDGITKGRGGLGSIFVWASGNGGREQDDCNCDGYTSSIYTMSISGATERGNSAWYSEACSSTLATTYSSGGEKQIVTTDLRRSCTEAHTGTSASAPLAAGIIALTLEANPNLTWRDVQHIVVETAKDYSLNAEDWVSNGVGKKVSHSFGFGLMDAGAMVSLARNWTTVPEQRICEIRSSEPSNQKIPGNSHMTVSLTTDGCEGTMNHVRFLEHVQARITMTSTRRGEIRIFLISPSGTRSTLLAKRKQDVSEEGFNNWAFMTTHNWGESAKGQWTLDIENGGSASELKEWTLVMMGTSTHHMRRNGSASRGGHGGHLGDDARAGVSGSGARHGTFTCAGVTSNGICIECKPGFFKMGENCVAHCPKHYYGSVQAVQLATPIKPNSTKPLLHTQGVCKPCHESCSTCKGSVAQDCYQCASGFERKGDLCEKKMIWDVLDPEVMKHLAWAIIICIAAILLFSVVFGLLQARDRGRLCWQTKPNYVPDWSKGHYDGVSPPGWRGSKFAPLPDPPAENAGTTDSLAAWRKDCTDSSLTSGHLSSWQSGSLRMMHDSGVGSGPGSSPPPSTISSPSSRNSPGWRHITGKSAPLPPIPPSSLPLLTCPPSPPPLPPSDHLDWGNFPTRRGGKRVVGESMIPPPPSWRDKAPHQGDEPPPLPPRPNRPVEAFWEAAGPGTGTHFLSAAGSSVALPDDACPRVEGDSLVQEAGMVLEPGSGWLAGGARNVSSGKKDEGRRHHHRRHHRNGQHSQHNHHHHHHHHHHRGQFSAGLMPAFSPTRHQEEAESEADEEVRRLHLQHQYQDSDKDLDSSIDTEGERVNPKFVAHTPPPPTPPPAKISPPQRQLHNQRHQVQTLYPVYKLHMYKGSPTTNSSPSSSSGAQDV